MDGLTEDAVAFFVQAYELSPRWQTAYNIAVLTSRSGDAPAALEYVRKAERILEKDSPLDSETKALLRAATARILYEKGDYEGASREAMYALDLDPGSDEAAIILKLLEGRSKNQLF